MDIDIDFKSDFDPKSLFPKIVRASKVDKGALRPHNCGCYLQTMPVDEITGLAAIPFKEAPVFGFFKIDFLHLSLLDVAESKDELRALSKKEPNWKLLLDEDVVAKLFQLKNSAELLSSIKPTSVEELADCIALIRPSKRYLIDKYVRYSQTKRETLREELYSKPHNDKQWFKKAHAIAYALTIVAQLHYIAQGKM